MQVFLGWPYEVSWVREKIIALIETYDVKVLTGEGLHGEKLTDGVKARIEQADTAIFIATRRSKNAQSWSTSDWVVSEIQYAKALNKDRVLVIRESDVDYPDKLDDERQHVVVEPGDVGSAMLACAKAVGRWKGLMFKLQLLPEEFVKNLRIRVVNDQYKCEYTLRENGKEIATGVAKIVREGKGLFVYLHDLPIPKANAYLELMVDGGDRWFCPGVQLSALEVTMERASS
jgi:hypothetical protein